MATSRTPFLAALFCLLLLAAPLSGCGAGESPPPPADLRTATSLEDAGGMKSLVAAAQREGRLNAVALPRDWANYGAIIDGFQKKYGIAVHVDNPSGSSRDAVAAATERPGSTTAPDVLDIDGAHAQAAAEQGLITPYRVAAFDKIPDTHKDGLARWSHNYGGYISIGCATDQVPDCPRTFAELLKPGNTYKVALNGNPKDSGSALAAVYAAALANGGALDDIRPGLDFFAQLADSGIYTPAQPTKETITSGRTPVAIDWDYINTKHWEDLVDTGTQWSVAVPEDGKFARYYAMAVSTEAPHPAAARLWQEYVFSTEAQNLRLRGSARPVLMDVMEENGTLDVVAAGWLPVGQSSLMTFPTSSQAAEAKRIVSEGWDAAVRP